MLAVQEEPLADEAGRAHCTPCHTRPFASELSCDHKLHGFISGKPASKFSTATRGEGEGAPNADAQRFIADAGTESEGHQCPSSADMAAN